MKIINNTILLFFLLIKTIICSNEKPINIKVVPSRSNKLTIHDLDSLKMEILHDMNDQIKNMEYQMADYERLKEKTSSNWSKSGAPIFLPNNPTNLFLKNVDESLKADDKGNNKSDDRNRIQEKEEIQENLIENQFNKINNPSILEFNVSNIIVEDKLKKLTKKLEESNEAIKRLNQEKYEKQRFKQISHQDNTYSDIEIINKLEEQNNELSKLNNDVMLLSNKITNKSENQSFIIQKEEYKSNNSNDAMLKQSINRNAEELKKILI